MENFADNCDDIISWISSPNYLPSFTEGWATYVEYPLMAQETNVYANSQDKTVLLQKYGMLKYQVKNRCRSSSLDLVVVVCPASCADRGPFAFLVDVHVKAAMF